MQVTTHSHPALKIPSLNPTPSKLIFYDDPNGDQLDPWRKDGKFGWDPTRSPLSKPALANCVYNPKKAKAFTFSKLTSTYVFSTKQSQSYRCTYPIQPISFIHFIFFPSLLSFFQ